MRNKYLKLIPNRPETITFAEIPPSKTEGQYGPRFEYAVNGSQVFTASAYLSDLINAALDSLSPGEPRVLTITQRRENNRTRYDVETLAESEDMPWDKPNTGAKLAPSVSTGMRDFPSIVNDYASCLVHADLICRAQWEDRYDNEDVRAVATTLFIEANRAGVSIPNPYGEDTEVIDEE